MQKLNKYKTLYYQFTIGTRAYSLLEELSVLVNSGLDIVTALNSLSEETSDRFLKKLIDDIKTRVDNGLPLWEALDETKLFEEYAISMIRIGEQSGKLSANLGFVVTAFKKNNEFKKKVTQALIYPGLVVSLTVIVGLAIAWFVLPRLAGVFDSLNVDLPFLTRMVIILGNFLKAYGIYVVPGTIVGLFLGLYLIFINKKLNFIGQFILRKLPVSGSLIKYAVMSRMGYVVGSLLSADISIVETFEALSRAESTHIYSKAYALIGLGINDGFTIRESIKMNNLDYLFDASVIERIAAAERAGSLEKSFLELGVTYESKAEITSKNLTILIEPIMLIVVWLGVLFIALSVILPVYGIIQGVDVKRNTQTKENGVDVASGQASLEDVINAYNAQETVRSLRILDTEVGYLNVRDDSDSSGNLITTVSVGNEYVYENVRNGWYYIVVEEDVKGWVFGTYVQIID